MEEICLWTSSNSPQAFVARVRVPDLKLKPGGKLFICLILPIGLLTG